MTPRDAVKPVAGMVAAMGDGTKIPTELLPGVLTAAVRHSPGCKVGISFKERNTKNSTKKFLTMYWNTKTVRIYSWSWALAD